MKLKGPRQRAVANPRNSTCSARISDLDFSWWFTDGSFESFYLHVRHKDGETIHRVRCRASQTPRLALYDGVLYWLIDHAEPAAPRTRKGGSPPARAAKAARRRAK